MHVPRHITITGRRDQKNSNQFSHPIKEGTKLAYQMNVPERIFVAGGNEIRGDRAQPSEVMFDRMDISFPTSDLTNPGTLTLDKGPCPEIEENLPRTKNNLTPPQGLSTSLAVEENPLFELKLMKRQLGRLATRLIQLEDNFERRKAKESFLWTYVFSVTGLLLYLLFKKKI
ncbi:unnamed protein product [Thelazia callipaeda]|uniref:Mitochondrial fission factor n=1 Tax=Thelazia callipaeda TaxID=103827 RepID=A0A0N5DA51_THECL|nr:unnamed protein product [Thelazia callipaeda]